MLTRHTLRWLFGLILSILAEATLAYGDDPPKQQDASSLPPPVELTAQSPDAGGEQAQSKPATNAGHDLFGPTKVWAVHLDIPADEFDAMQPAPPTFAGPGNPPQPAQRREDLPKDKRDGERNLFGTEFPWAAGQFTADGQTLKKIGVRYAGDITYFVSAQSAKRPFKVRFDKFNSSGQPFHGISSLQLHAMPLDASKAREVLAFSVFRNAGVPTPRTAFAEVTLNVTGKYDKEYLGLYTVVEGVDGRFLADRFPLTLPSPPSDGGEGRVRGGLLMKPFRIRGIDYLGDDWSRYKDSYQPQREATNDEAKRVIDFARLVNQAFDEEFRRQIESFLDVNAFLRFMAANALTSNLESFFALGHNYHLYLDPKTNKFAFIPGDLEFSLANFLLMGSPEQLMDLSLTKPYAGENKLPDPLLAINEVNERYRSSLSAAVFVDLIEDAEPLLFWHRSNNARYIPHWHFLKPVAFCSGLFV